MAKKHEFRPDSTGTGVLEKLWLTPLQQLRVLRWVLFGVICLVGLLLQDVLLYRFRLGGGCTDLVPCLILMIAVLQGAESGSSFALVMSVLYFFSGSAPGVHVIPLLTAVVVFAVIFRQSCLQQGFWAILLCAVAGMLLYEMGLYAVGLFLKQTVAARVGGVLMTVVLSAVTVPVAYPLLLAVGKIGGQTWKE